MGDGERLWLKIMGTPTIELTPVTVLGGASLGLMGTSRRRQSLN